MKTTPYDDAGILARIKNAYPGENVVHTQSYLRLEAALATQTNINFNVLQNVGNANVTERRLAITDVFTITGISMMIYKAGAAAAATQAEIAVSVLRTWPNAQVFTGVGEASNLMAFYNSFLTIKVDSRVYLNAMDLMRFYRVGTSQQNVGSSAVSNVAVQRDEFTETNYGFAKMAPTISLSGAGNNEISVQLPSSINLAGTSSQNFAVCYLRGILSQNASKLNPGAGI